MITRRTAKTLCTELCNNTTGNQIRRVLAVNDIEAPYLATETTYGAMPEVDAAVAVVRHAHQPVRGTSERDRAYNAAKPEMAAWVHNVLTDSFLAAFQAFGPEPLNADDADRFVAEQTNVGRLLGAAPLPDTATGLRLWIANHDQRAISQAQINAIEFLQDPPLSIPVRVGYRLLYNAAVTTIPQDLNRQLGIQATRGAAKLGRTGIQAMRWALGASPSWQLALTRCDAPIPAGLFRQPLPQGSAND